MNTIDKGAITMNSIDLSGAQWRKSRYSNGQASCVEVKIAVAAVAVRDTKDRTGPMLVFSPQEWRAFTACVQRGEFDLD
jgi:hypothetical protein